MKNARSIAIWTSGTLGCGLVGAIIGDAMAGYNEPYGFFGFIAGALLFTCFRLWATPKTKEMPVYDLKDGKLQ